MSSVVERAEEAISNGAQNHDLLSALIAEIERLEEENRQLWNKANVSAYAKLLAQATRYREALERIEDVAQVPNKVAACIDILLIATEALKGG